MAASDNLLSMDTTIAWLLQGDPAIRWQTQRDLLDAPASEWQAEQARTLHEGWGARLLAEQEADGRWGGGLYSPKWTSTTFTLLMLRAYGIPRQTPAAQRGAALVLDGMLGERCDDAFRTKLAQLDRCIVGMVLSLAVYFEIDDARVDAIIENVLGEMMPDGAWNCRKHSNRAPNIAPFTPPSTSLMACVTFLNCAQATIKTIFCKPNKAPSNCSFSTNFFVPTRLTRSSTPDFSSFLSAVLAL